MKNTSPHNCPAAFYGWAIDLPKPAQASANPSLTGFFISPYGDDEKLVSDLISPYGDDEKLVSDFISPYGDDEKLVSDEENALLNQIINQTN